LFTRKRTLENSSLATLLLTVSHVTGNQYSFAIILTDDQGVAIPDILVEYYQRRTAPLNVPGGTGKMPAWSDTPIGSAYTAADGSIHFDATFDASVTGFLYEWKVNAPTQNVWSDVWEFTVGAEPYRIIIEASPPVSILPMLLPAIILTALGTAFLIWWFYIRKPKPQPVQIIPEKPLLEQ
jgi:hypothetical protein